MTLKSRVKVSHTQDLFTARNANSMVFIFGPILPMVCRLYEGCSNMNASSFISYVTYMLRQNGIRFYNGLYVTFKLAPNIKNTTVFLSSYSPLNEGHFSILKTQCFEHTSDIDECIILRYIGDFFFLIS